MSEEINTKELETDQGTIQVPPAYEEAPLEQDDGVIKIEEENLKDASAESENFEMLVDYADLEEKENDEWKERTGLDEESLCGAIETIVFLSDRPITITKIRDTLDKGMPLRVVHTALERLSGEYESAHHGIRLQEIGEGFQFRTKPTYTKHVQDLFKFKSIVLSPTALEALAVIAYKQPVSRAELDKIRGVDSSHLLRMLMDKRLVKISGKTDELGKPVAYGTTQEFLEMFNLRSLDELPPEHELESLADNQNVGEISDIKELVRATDEARSKFENVELEEIDELKDMIKSISTGTDFTKTLKTANKIVEEGTDPKSAFDILEEFVEKKSLDDIQTEEVALSEEDKQTLSDLRKEEPKESTEPLFFDEGEEGESELEKALDNAFSKLEESNNSENSIEGPIN